MLETPSGVASNGLPAPTQHAVQTLSIEEIICFWSFELLLVFSQGNNSIHYFYCQTGGMFAWELVAVLLDKSKARQVV